MAGVIAVAILGIARLSLAAPPDMPTVESPVAAPASNPAPAAAGPSAPTPTPPPALAGPQSQPPLVDDGQALSREDEAILRDTEFFKLFDLLLSFDLFDDDPG